MTIGHLVHNENQTLLSAHADYRPEDYAFQREQSRTSRNAEWEHREPPLEPLWKSWMNAIIVIAIGILAFPVIEFLVDLMKRGSL